MDKILVRGGKKLQGSVRVSGAKNAALPLLFSTLLADGTHSFSNVPNLKDIESTIALLENLGCEIDNKFGNVNILTKPSKSQEAHYELVRKMRASVLCLGPLLTRYGFARVSLPGGCAIGARPIDLHLEALEKMGAKIELKEGYVEARATKLKGENIIFDTVTVTGTENLLMAAVLADGVTVLENAAKEPEIMDLAKYLISMGAKIEGAGTGIITVTGVSKLTPAKHTVMPDRIEAGTLLLAAAISKGEVNVLGIDPFHLDALSSKLIESGFRIDSNHGAEPGIKIFPSEKWVGVDITTAPFPGFATDLQAQFMALMTLARGTSILTETIFENRFMHVTELQRLGADISPKSRVAIVRGKETLTGAPVMATDLRASASLVLAGLAAVGETLVGRVYHLDRGYENLVGKLQSLGADIARLA